MTCLLLSLKAHLTVNIKYYIIHILYVLLKWDINLLQPAAFQFILLKKAGKPIPHPPKSPKIPNQQATSQETVFLIRKYVTSLKIKEYAAGS